ncbi:MAG TPA: N-acetyl-D-Glu racemase DgcA [Oleiagrimonas sp.]|nr:N-acetyl-D-Glu racemase DgcA [Oleiagrimonas sp.]
MLRELTVRHCRFQLKAPFRISRGVRYATEVLIVQLRQGDKIGRGQCVPYARYGESLASVIAQIEALREELGAGMGRDELQWCLAPGAARNALDAALWDLESQLTGIPVYTQLGCPPARSLTTALTVGIDTPEHMEQAAARLGNAALVKIKVDADHPAARIEAVRRAVPNARMIVDPNESWNIDLLHDLQPVLQRAGVDLLEQPLPADADDALLDYTGSIPVCADEACHVSADLPRLRGRYHAVNIKLDKTGGLTEAWRLLHAARADGFTIMVGCMVCSSLGIAPALEIARHASFVDLDGPFLLERDDADGITFEHGRLIPPPPGFWGE